MASLAPESIYSIGQFNVTNTLLATAILDIILIGAVYKINKGLSLIPTSYLQNATENLIEYFYDMTEQISGKFTKSIFPWFASFFIVIFIANLMGLIPGFGTFGFYKIEEGKQVFIPILRAATSDFNTTFALAAVSVVATHVLSIKYNGLKHYLMRYFSLNPILLFVGFLEIISEGTKFLSLSFRLFGNIYAGEVVLSTVSSLFAFIAPLPFIMLETIVAFVQALVFAMLTMVFMAILIAPHSTEEGGDH